jgi:hypothetical protein
MAESNEIILAITWRQAKALAARLGIAWLDPSQADRIEFGEQVEARLDAALSPALLEAHLEIVQARFDPNARVLSGDWVVDGHALYGSGGKILSATREGPRLFTPFRFLAHGSDEMGDEWPGDYIAGVPLSGRYSPMWLDWRDENGGNLDKFFMDDPDMRAMMEQARQAVAARIPEFAAARYAVVLCFY